MCPTPRRCGAIVAALVLALSCGSAFAQATPADAGQAYPVKPIRLIVPAGQMAELLRAETARHAEIARSAGLPRE